MTIIPLICSLPLRFCVGGVNCRYLGKWINICINAFRHCKLFFFSWYRKLHQIYCSSRSRSNFADGTCKKRQLHCHFLLAVLFLPSFFSCEICRRVPATEKYHSARSFALAYDNSLGKSLLHLRANKIRNVMDSIILSNDRELELLQRSTRGNLSCFTYPVS